MMNKHFSVSMIDSDEGNVVDVIIELERMKIYDDLYKIVNLLNRYQECVEELENENKELKNLNMSNFKIIFDFCDWLGEQGSAYETLYYGREEDIVKLINMYLKEEVG